jgi:quercetin dioxygenase-like cupin family protein
MIGKIERSEAQPTAALLGRLSGALGMTLSELVARVEGDDQRLVRAADQPTWIDPGSGYWRRTVSPATGGPLKLVEFDLPAGAEISYPADAYVFIHQQIWILQGHLRFHEGDTEHELRPGDCLQLAPRHHAHSSTRPARPAVTSSRSPGGTHERGRYRWRIGG